MPSANRIAGVGSAAWRRLAALAAAAGLLLAFHAPAVAQEPEVAADAEPLSAAELDELVGPIALYPDDLIAIVLPASTYPLQIVQAARFLEERESDPSLEPDEEWDDSVVALLNYPEVVELLNRDLDWTWRLGEAVLTQRAEVLDAVQRFRDRAYAAGNLRTDERQVVTRDGGAIAIKPADPEVIYVPYYEPRTVVVRHAVPVYYYYPVAYPVYYYPYPVGYTFHTGFFWGVTTVFSIGWHDHLLHAYHHHHHLHPFFGWHYHAPFYVRRGLHINVNVLDGIWHPRHRYYGSRPHYDVRVNGGRVTRSREGYVNRAATRSDGYRTSRSTGYRTSRPSAAQPGVRTYRGTAPGTRAPTQTTRGTVGSRAPAATYRGTAPGTRAPTQTTRGTVGSRAPAATYRGGAATQRAPTGTRSLGGAVGRAVQPRAHGGTAAPRAAPPRASVAPRASASPRPVAPRSAAPGYRSSGSRAAPRASGGGRPSLGAGSTRSHRASGGARMSRSHGGRNVR